MNKIALFATGSYLSASVFFTLLSHSAFQQYFVAFDTLIDV
jgi:hypothetical protein